MSHIVVNKDTVIDHLKAEEPLAVIEIRYGGEVKWTNKHGLVDEV